MKNLLFGVAFVVGLVSPAVAQDNHYAKALLSKAEKLRKSLEVEIGKSETAFMEEFRKLKDITLAEIDVARKAKTANDDLDSALALRDAAREVEGITWLSAKSVKLKKVEWEFFNRNGNRLVKQADGNWVESSNESFVWVEKQRNDVCIILYEPNRDIWGRLYEDVFFTQFPAQRSENVWHLMEGKWIR